jgi:hypothetical protein
VTGVDVTGGDALGVRHTRHLNGGGALGGGPVPELAFAVPAPALHLAVGQQGTRVVATEGDARRLRPKREKSDERDAEKASATHLGSAYRPCVFSHTRRWDYYDGGGLEKYSIRCQFHLYSIQ